MPTSVRLDIKTEQVLARLARRKGISKSAVLREAVEVLARQSLDSPKPSSLYQQTEDLIGCVSGGPSDLSTRPGARFREILLRKRGQQR